MSLIAEYQNIVIWAIGIIVFVFLTVMATKFATKSQHDQLRRDFDEANKSTDKRISYLEQNYNNLPTQKQFTDLQIAMTKLEGEMGRFTEMFNSADEITERLQKQIDRVEDFLRVAPR